MKQTNNPPQKNPLVPVVFGLLFIIFIFVMLANVWLFHGLFTTVALPMVNAFPVWLGPLMATLVMTLGYAVLGILLALTTMQAGKTLYTQLKELSKSQ